MATTVNSNIGIDHTNCPEHVSHSDAPDSLLGSRNLLPVYIAFWLSYFCALHCKFSPSKPTLTHTLILRYVRGHSNAPQNGITNCIFKTTEGCLVTLQLVLWAWNLNSTASLHQRLHLIPFQTRRRLPVILPVRYHQPFCISRTTAILLAVCFLLASPITLTDMHPS
jgi:hypothetical protein